MTTCPRPVPRCNAHGWILPVISAGMALSPQRAKRRWRRRVAELRAAGPLTAWRADAKWFCEYRSNGAELLAEPDLAHEDVFRRMLQAGMQDLVDAERDVEILVGGRAN